MVNALVVAERRKKIAPGTTSKFLQDLQQLSIIIDLEGIDQIFSVVLDQARRYQRSSYDASYLELALRLSLPLATRDEPLKKAAMDLGIRVYQP